MENIAAKPAKSDAPSAYGEIVRVYGNVGAFIRTNLSLLWFGLFLLLWIFNPIKALPYPSEVLAAFRQMWSAPGSQGMVYNIWVTLKLNIVGLLFSSIISLIVAYLSVIPLFQPFNKNRAMAALPAHRRLQPRLLDALYHRLADEGGDAHDRDDLLSRHEHDRRDCGDSAHEIRTGAGVGL